MIEAAGLAATEGYRVPTVAQHVAIHDHSAVASAASCERMCERGVRCVFYGEIFQNKIVCVIQIDDRPPQLVGMRDKIVFYLRKLNARSLATLTA